MVLLLAASREYGGVPPDHRIRFGWHLIIAGLHVHQYVRGRIGGATRTEGRGRVAIALDIRMLSGKEEEEDEDEKEEEEDKGKKKKGMVQPLS
jgi:hypothetical protein